VGQSHANIKPCRLGAKLAGLEKDLDLPFSNAYDWELMLGLEGDILRFRKVQKFRT